MAKKYEDLRKTIKEYSKEYLKNPYSIDVFINECCTHCKSRHKDFTEEVIKRQIQGYINNLQKFSKENQASTIESEYKTSSRKKNGIKGRTDDISRQERIEICKELLDRIIGPKGLQYKDFKREYAKVLSSKGFTVPSRNTIKSDITEAGYNIDNGRISEPSGIAAPLRYFADHYAKIIKTIHFVAKSYDITLFNQNSWDIETSRDEFISQLSESLPKIKADRLCHMYIILTESGFEQKIASFFIKPTYSDNNFDFISIHSYCVEFVFEFSKANKLLAEIFELLRRLDK